MSRLAPVKLRLVKQDWTQRVVSPAYDALTPDARRQWAELNGDSYLHVTRSPEDLPEGTEVTTEQLAELGRESLQALISKGAFTDLTEPGIYLYQLAMENHYQTAVLASLLPEAFVDDVYLHEETRPGRVEILAQHLQTVGYSSSPVALTFESNRDVSTAITHATADEPLIEFVTENAVTHRVWRASQADAEILVTALDDVEIYMLDGHHRSGAAVWQHNRGRPCPVLVAAFPNHQLNMFPIDRWLSLGDLSSDEILEKVKSEFSVSEIQANSLDQARPTEPGSVAMWLGEKWYSIELASAQGESLGASLDVVRLRSQILAPILGATDSDLVYIPNIGNGELERRCAEDTHCVAFVLASMRVSDLFAVARSDEVLPPKSTFFHPKVRSGLFLFPAPDC